MRIKMVVKEVTAMMEVIIRGNYFAGNVAVHRVLAAAGGGGDYCSDVIFKASFF